MTADGFGNCRLLGLRSAAASWRALQLGCFFMFPGLLFDRFISELCSIIRSCIKWSVLGSKASSLYVPPALFRCAMNVESDQTAEEFQKSDNEL